jgi:hypothetical protein
MGHKSVCFNCKKAFSLGSDFTRPKHTICPECKGEVFIYPHRFRPPAKNDNQKWEVIKCLKDYHFFYQHIHEEYEHFDKNGVLKICSRYAQYPETMREAKDFVFKYSKKQP